MNKLDCPIVRDLRPLYIDQVTGPETTQAVEAHLAACPVCRRERDELQGDLPGSPPQEADTVQQFGTMMRKLKRKEARRAALAVLLVCAAVAAGLFVIFGLPLQVTDNEDAKLHRIYAYENAQGENAFFVVYERSLYQGLHQLASSVKQEDGRDILQLDLKREPFRRQDPVHAEQTETIPVPDWADIAEVRLGNGVIWTREANGGDPVPEYVYAYEAFSSADGSILTWTVELDGEDNHTDYPAPFLWAVYEDGHQILWDLDGNVLRQTP